MSPKVYDPVGGTDTLTEGNALGYARKRKTSNPEGVTGLSCSWCLLFKFPEKRDAGIGVDFFKLFAVHDTSNLYLEDRPNLLFLFCTSFPTLSSEPIDGRRDNYPLTRSAKP